MHCTVTVFSPGNQFLCLQHVTSKIREKAFAFALLTVILVGISAWLLMIVTWKESYLNYFLMRFNFNQEFSGFTVIALLVHLAIEAALIADDVCNFLVSISILYLSCFSMNFWLQKIW